jgi:hypothetical protein
MNGWCSAFSVWGVAALVACSSNDAGPQGSMQAGAGGAAGASGAAGAAGAAGTAGTQVAAGGGGASGAGAGGTAGGGAAGLGGTGGAGGTGGTGGMANPLNALAQPFEAFRMDLECDHDQEQPCEPQNAATPNLGYLCCYVDQSIERTNHPPVDKTVSLGGDAGKLYDVTLRVRGVVENRDYGDGGMEVGDWVHVGGARPAPSAIHVFGITTKDPEQTYFLNSWNDASDPIRLVALDYEVTLRMRGGSQAQIFEYDDIGKIWKNAGDLKVEGVPPYPDAAEGQFMLFNVVSVEVVP